MNNIKKLINNSLSIGIIRDTYNSFNKYILVFFSSNRLLGTVYSFFGFFTFNREQYAVLSGRKNYYKNLDKQRQSHVELRRNVHRLEKGSLMQPRRETFATDYIEETVEFYKNAVEQYEVGEVSIDESELMWAQNVLHNYFTIVKQVGKIKNAFDIFAEIDYTAKSRDKVPYQRKKSVMSNLTYEEFLDLSMQRRSVRWFTKKKVSRKLIDKALLVARQSPSACNRLPYQFRIFDDPQLVKEVVGIPFGAGGYAKNIPTVIVVVGKLNSYFSPRDRHTIYIDASLAAMSFMLALETLGLSSSVINWPDFEPLENKMQKKLKLDYDERVIMLMAVGHADPNAYVAYSQKKSLEVIRTYNDI